MRPAPAAVSLAILLGACQLEAPPPPPSPAQGGPASNETPDGTSGGRFFCRTDGGQVRELVLRKFAVGVTTRPGTVRSHLTMDVAGPTGERVEAVMRLAVPRGAAVTSAILWVNGRPMNGAFVQRDRAREIYRSIVERRRDPALVAWDGPGWVSVSIFPLERGEPRRFEIEWIEPVATAAGIPQYRVPTIVNAGRVIGRPSLEVDGHPRPTTGRDVVALAAAPGGVAQIVAGRTPGDPFHRLLVRTSPAAPVAPAAGTARVVMVAKTSAAMTAVDRFRQRAAIESVLGALPATSIVTLLAADWNVSVIADQVVPAEARLALAQLDGIPSAGALHLERTLTDAAARAGQSAATAILFVGRGLDGFGADAIRGPLGHLREAGVRLSVVAMTDLPPPLADAAALTGGEVLRAARLDDEIGALAEALRSRPSPPPLVARDIDWRARNHDRTNRLGGARARAPAIASQRGGRHRRGGRGGSVASLGSRPSGLVGARCPRRLRRQHDEGADSPAGALGPRERARVRALRPGRCRRFTARNRQRSGPRGSFCPRLGRAEHAEQPHRQ
jgi:hypothetical protein